MGEIQTYFKQHPWQRRVLTLLLTTIVAASLAIWLGPIYFDHKRIEQLDSPDGQVRQIAVAQLVAIARQRPASRQRILEALPTQSDRRFLGLQRVLVALNAWPPPTQPKLWQDRSAAIEFERSYVRDPLANPRLHVEAVEAARRRRMTLLYQAILSGRDNRYVRQLLQAAISDIDPSIQAEATTLAARLGAFGRLGEMLDGEPSVAAAAVFNAALADRADLAGEILRQLYRRVPQFQRLSRRVRHDIVGPLSPAQRQARSQSMVTVEALRDLIANSYDALLRWDVPHAGAQAADLAIFTDDLGLRQRLLWVISGHDGPQSRRAIQEISARWRWQGQAVPAMVLVAGQRLAMGDLAIAALEILRQAAEGSTTLLVSQVMAAMDYAIALNVPSRQWAYDFIANRWRAAQPLLMAKAARLLGHQAALSAGQASDAPSRDQCMELLQRATLWSRPVEGQPAGLTTPYASAAAACAQWRLDPTGEVLEVDSMPTSEDLLEMLVHRGSGWYVREAAAVEAADPGDLIAWQLAASGDPLAFELAQALLPDADQPFREYNPAVRETGMLLMALSARDDAQKELARQRISARLPHESYYVRVTAKCALLMLGEQQYQTEIRMLMATDDYPLRRTLTTLLVDGNRGGLDVLLWNVNWSLDEVADTLLSLGLDEVLAETAPRLPRLSLPASQGVQRWQMRRIHYFYGLFREQLETGKRP